MGMDIPKAYLDVAAKVFAGFQTATDKLTRSSEVAEAVWHAATDPFCSMHLPAGADADAVAWA